MKPIPRIWICSKCETKNSQRKHLCVKCRNAKAPWQQTMQTRKKYNSPV